MRAALAALSLAACAVPPEGEPPSMANEDAPRDLSAGNCDAAPAQRLLGRTATQALGAEALRLSGATTLRWAPPGAVLTMDYRQDRLTIGYTADLAIDRISCG